MCLLLFIVVLLMFIDLLLIVTDFIDVGIGAYRWPIFNVADSAITIGFILLFIRLPAIKRDLIDDAPSR